MTTQTPRYTIVKEEWVPDGMDCDHPLCDPLHRQWYRREPDGRVWCDKPAGKRTEWLIIDAETGERAKGYLGDSFSTRREARQRLDRHLAREAQA